MPELTKQTEQTEPTEPTEPTKINIFDSEERILIGCVYYGDPFHTEKGWSQENEIGKTWGRFNRLFEKNKEALSKYQINSTTAYEIHIEPEEYSETKKFYVFVGIEVNKIEYVPIEMFVKRIPATKYACFTFKGENMFKGGSYIWDEWYPQSNYEEELPIIIQAYDSTRFSGLGEKDTELDYYISIKEKQKK